MTRCVDDLHWFTYKKHGHVGLQVPKGKGKHYNISWLGDEK